MARELADWSVAQLAAAAAAGVHAEMLAGCNVLRIAAEWAHKHPGDGLPLEIKLNNGVDERRLVVGGDGTPDVAASLACGHGSRPARSRPGRRGSWRRRPGT
jgi:hypothetical protein